MPSRTSDNSSFYSDFELKSYIKILNFISVHDTPKLSVLIACFITCIMISLCSVCAYYFICFIRYLKIKVRIAWTFLFNCCKVSSYAGQGKILV